MNKKLKKALSVFLAILMLLSSAPLEGLTGIKLPDLFKTEAQAGSLNQYCATAAAQWAKDHWSDYDSILLGKGYYSPRGDCANFVSQCLYMGGIDMDTYWNTSRWDSWWGMYYEEDLSGSFIRVDQLYNYLTTKLGATAIRNPSADQISVGDVLIYAANRASDKTHCSIVIDKNSSVITVAAHSVDGPRDRYKDTNWRLGFSGNLTWVIKMNGSLCFNNNPRNFDVYINHTRSPLYKTTNTKGGYNRSLGVGEYAHIYKKTADGKMGYTFNYGDWGWVVLSDFSYQRHVSSANVDHDWGNWTVKKVANCQQDGLSERVCKRCGKVEQKTTKGGHIAGKDASCLEPSVCKICSAVLTPALGHDSTGKWKVTLEPTCTEKGEKKLYCKRVSNGVLCDVHLDTAEIPALGHDYIPGATDPNCVDNGTKTYKCSRCGDSYIDYIDVDNTWSDWTEEVHDLPAGKVKSKVQYRYSDKSTTTSYQTSLDGWTQDGGKWVQSDSGSFEYVDSGWPQEMFDNGSGHGLYSYYNKYNRSPKTNSETATNKTVASSTNLRYIFWHYCA